MNSDHASWLEQLSIGSHLEIADKYERWCIGIVEEIEDAGKRMKISYFGWSSKWTEWIDTLSDDSKRIALLHTHIVPTTFCEPPKPINPRWKDQLTCCISTDFIISVMIHPSINDTIIVEKYSKLSNQYNQAEIQIPPAHNYIKMATFDEDMRQLSILMYSSRSGNDTIYVLDIDTDTNEVINEAELITSAYTGTYFGAFINEGLIHIIHYCHDKPVLSHGVLNSGSDKVKYYEQKLKVKLSLTNVFVDEEKNLIYAFDKELPPNVCCMKFIDWEGLELLQDKISSPWDDISSLILCSMVHVYNCLIIVFFRSNKCGDIWVLDLRNKEWFKSKYQIPFTCQSNVIDGKDNFIYFVCHGTNPASFNFKVSLFDIIPSEVYETDTEENCVLIHGFMKDISRNSDMIYPDSLINVIAVYYSRLLYV